MALKHAKFDSFLKRTLDIKAYEQVKLCDPCVVLSRNERHTFRFAFLTDEAICITDNPPKSILFTIPLKHVRDVQLVHDTASFLQKDLQNIAQHIHVTCVKTKESRTSLHSDSSLIRSSSSNSLLKSAFSSLLNKSQSTSLSTASTSPTPSVLSDTSTSLKKSTYNTNSHNNVGRESSHNYSNGSFLPATLCMDQFDDTISVAGSSFSDHQGTSPRNQSKWTNCDPYVTEVLEPEYCDNTNEDIHLYILNDSSMFFMMLKVIWRSYLLNATLCMDLRSPASANFSLNRDITNILFAELKEDIVHSFQQTATVENLYKYFHELKSVATGSISVKTHFWKDSDLFLLCGNFLEKYTDPGSPYHDERADEIECMILVAETISTMFKQTEALTTCHKVLQKFSNTSYSNLISALLQKPTLSNALKYDAELKGLALEYTMAACDVIFELITAAEQVSWNCPDVLHPTFTSPSLFSIMDHSSTLGIFVGQIMTSCVEIWTSKHDHDSSILPSPRSSGSNAAPSGPLTPNESVKIYHWFTVLHRCLSKCKQVKLQAKQTFKEEFKYYIRPESLQSKLPANYAASGITRNIVSAVACCVLDEDQISK